MKKTYIIIMLGLAHTILQQKIVNLRQNSYQCTMVLSWSNEVSMQYQIFITQLKTCMLPSYKILVIYASPGIHLQICSLFHFIVISAVQFYDTLGDAQNFTLTLLALQVRVASTLHLSLSLSVFVCLSALPPFVSLFLSYDHTSLMAISY